MAICPRIGRVVYLFLFITIAAVIFVCFFKNKELYWIAKHQSEHKGTPKNWSPSVRVMFCCLLSEDFLSFLQFISLKTTVNSSNMKLYFLEKVASVTDVIDNDLLRND